MILSWLAVSAAIFTPPVSQLDVVGHRVYVSQPPAPDTCDFNRILPDPSSRRLAVWRRSRDLGDDLTWAANHFAVADLAGDDIGAAPLPRLARVGGMVRVEPVRWSQNGDRLLLRVSDNGVALFDPAHNRLTDATSLDPLWHTVRTAAISHGDLDFYRRPDLLAALRHIGKEGAPVRTHATVDGTSAAFLVLRYGNGRILTGYGGGKRWETGVPNSFASAPLLPPGSHRPLFMGDQTGYRSFLPYAMPLVDLSNGRIVGRFGWERIGLRGGRTIDLAPRFRQIMNILDAAANGQTIFALVDLEREKRIVRIQNGGMRTWQLCEKKGLVLANRVFPASNALPAGIQVSRGDIRFTAGTDSARPGPFGQLYRPRDADGRLIVYFHGGPTGTLAERTVPDLVSSYATHGISVLNVEYSGMLGGGLSLSERLPRLGIRALRQDVERVTRWVRRSGFKRVFLLADSFGGAPGVIAALDQPTAYDHIFLRAPFLALRDPAESVRRRKPLNVANTHPASQLEFEQLVYGGARGRARFGTVLQAYVRRLRPSPRLSFYFGGLDPVSAVTDLPASFSGDRSVMIVPRVTHEFVAGLPEVTRDILSKISSPAAQPKRSGEAQR